MKRSLITLAVLSFLSAISATCEPQQGASGYQCGSNPVVVISSSLVAHNPPLSEDRTQSTANSSAWWYAAVKRPEWWLVLVGFGTLIYLVVQLSEMKKATNAMRESAAATEKSVRLQEIALRQWVNIENWRSVPWIPQGGELSLHVQFDVVNATNLPLTLNSVFIMLGEQGGKVGRKNLIPPKKSQPVVTSVKITEEQALKWEDLKELGFIVNGYVEFEDVLEKVRSQPFSGFIECSMKDGVRFIPPYGSGLYIANEKKGDKTPN